MKRKQIGDDDCCPTRKRFKNEQPDAKTQPQTKNYSLWWVVEKHLCRRLNDNVANLIASFSQVPRHAVMSSIGVKLLSNYFRHPAISFNPTDTVAQRVERALDLWKIIHSMLYTVECGDPQKDMLATTTLCPAILLPAIAAYVCRLVRDDVPLIVVSTRDMTTKRETIRFIVDVAESMGPRYRLSSESGKRDFISAKDWLFDWQQDRARTVQTLSRYYPLRPTTPPLPVFCILHQPWTDLGNTNDDVRSGKDRLSSFTNPLVLTLFFGQYLVTPQPPAGFAAV